MSDVCKCQSPKPRPAGVGRVVCDGCGLEKKGDEDGAASVILTQDFARSLIGQHQKVILKHRQMIDDIKREFGLKE